MRQLEELTPEFIEELERDPRYAAGYLLIWMQDRSRYIWSAGWLGDLEHALAEHDWTKSDYMTLQTLAGGTWVWADVNELWMKFVPGPPIMPRRMEDRER